MSSKYNIDNILDPLGIKKAHDAMAVKADPFGMAKIRDAMAVKADPFGMAKIRDAMAIKADPFGMAKIHDAMAVKADPFGMAKIRDAMAVKADPFGMAKIRDAMAIKADPFGMAKIHDAMAVKADPFGMAKIHKVISRQANSIIRNESLGLQADIQKILAATTLMPELKNKIHNFDQKISNQLWLELQSLKNETSTFIQDNQDIVDDFNQKYDQDLQIDKNSAQAINLIIHNTDALDIASQLMLIGVFDTSSGSIIYEYFNNVSDERKNKVFISFILPIILTISTYLVSNFEPVKDFSEQIINQMNDMVTPPFLIELMGRKSKSLLLFKNRWTTIY